MKKLAIVSTHPIQYNAPLFRQLSKRNNLELKVFYTWGQANGTIYDPGFGIERQWDLDLLDGYNYEFVENNSRKPGSHHFFGINNPLIINVINRWDPDSILVFGWSFLSHLKVLLYFHKKKRLLFRGDSNLLDEANVFSVKRMIRTIFLRWVYAHVDLALYVGSANKRYYLKYGLKEHQLRFAPHAIDNLRFTSDRGADGRNVLGIPKDAVLFLFAGKFEKKKDPHLLLDSFIALNDPNTHLLLVGSGHMEHALKSKVLEQVLSIRNRIHFLPFQNQLKMPQVYKMADVYVLPSQGPGETWGLSVNEAMACGKAVLVSDKCGCSGDIVSNGINGYVFKSKDHIDLLDKMRLCLVSRSDLDKMGENSLAIINVWNYESICIAVENSIIKGHERIGTQNRNSLV